MALPLSLREAAASLPLFCRIRTFDFFIKLRYKVLPLLSRPDSVIIDHFQLAYCRQAVGSFGFGIYRQAERFVCLVQALRFFADRPVDELLRVVQLVSRPAFDQRRSPDFITGSFFGEHKRDRVTFRLGFQNVMREGNAHGRFA